MQRSLEIIFRRPFRLLALLIVLPLISLVVPFALPRTYETSSSLWALRRFEIIGATGAETNLNATPAETQAAALNELLQSKAFTHNVADGTGLAETMDAGTQDDPNKLDAAIFAELSHGVRVTPVNYNLYTIIYDNRSASVAQKVVAQVIKLYSSQSVDFATVEGNRFLDAYKSQLDQAKKDADKAAAAEADFLAQHPSLRGTDLLVNPTYGLLHAQTLQTQAAITDLQNKIATLNLEVSRITTGTDSLFTVLDQPVVANKPVSLSKSLLIAGGIGLSAAILACVLYVTLLLRRERTVYSAMDLRKLTMYPVLVQFPKLAPKATARALLREPA